MLGSSGLLHARMMSASFTPPPGAHPNPADIVGRGPDMVRHPMRYPLPDGRGEFTFLI
jgi:hypothetical protein